MIKQRRASAAKGKQGLLRLLFPDKCVLCRRLLQEGEEELCPQCRKDTKPYSRNRARFAHLTRIYGLWYYTETVRRSILRFKFRGHISYAPSYGALLARMLQQQEAEFDILTWVPVSLPRLLTRGYDQSRLLARYLGKHLGVRPVRLLWKVRHTKAQARSGKAPQRRANILGAYRCVRHQELKGKRVLLVDDILTTGATGSECARTLHAAGVASVSLAVLAVTDHSASP